MKKNNSWFWLVFAVIMILVIYLIAIFLLEYIIPFSRNVKWIENSSKSYYFANWWIEQWLWYVSQNDVWFSTWKILSSSPMDFSFEVISTWSTLPPPWEWNSNTDKDWNKIWLWESISMEVWYNKVSNWAIVNFDFRVPDFDMNWIYDLPLRDTSTPIINWQLSWENDTLNSSWSQIDPDFWTWKTWNSLDILNWYKLDDAPQTLNGFYNNNCWTSSWCIFKLFVISDLIGNNWGAKIPYIEWKADFWSAVPTQLIRIKSAWKSYWFTKDMSIKVPQRSILDAFDFTVFQ